MFPALHLKKSSLHYEREVTCYETAYFYIPDTTRALALRKAAFYSPYSSRTHDVHARCPCGVSRKIIAYVIRHMRRKKKERERERESAAREEKGRADWNRPAFSVQNYCRLRQGKRKGTSIMSRWNDVYPLMYFEPYARARWGNINNLSISYGQTNAVPASSRRI